MLTTAAEPIYFYRRNQPYGEFSNFHHAPMVIDGATYPTVEHYFQAMKATSESGHERIRQAETPAEAKRLGRRCTLVANWREVRDAVMLTALRAKFSQHPELATLLCSTAPRRLHEDAPNDHYWGCVGKDRLGALLMAVRDELMI